MTAEEDLSIRSSESFVGKSSYPEAEIDLSFDFDQSSQIKDQSQDSRTDSLSDGYASTNSTISVDVDIHDTLSPQPIDSSCFSSDLNQNGTIMNEVNQDEATSKKITVMDIFKNAKPSKIKKQEPLVPIDLPRVEVTERPKSGISAKDLLTGNKKIKSKDDSTSIPLIPITPHISDGVEVTKGFSGISVKDVLTGIPKIKKDTEDDVIEILSTEDEDVKQNKKFRNKKSSKRKNTKSDKSLVITFKYRSQSQKIAELEQKIRNSSNESVSAKDLFKRLDKKQELFVSLKLKPEVLRNLNQPKNSFFSKGVQVQGGKSYLELLSHKPTVLKNPVSKLKELPLPEIPRDAMHVKYPEESFIHSSISLSSKTQLTIDKIDLNQSFTPNNTPPKKHPFLSFKWKPASNDEILKLAYERIPYWDQEPSFQRFIDILSTDSKSTFEDLWTLSLRPRSFKDIFTSKETVSSLKNCLYNSFTILKRNTKRPNFKKQRRNDEMIDFIVDFDDEDTEEESFCPLIIIHGPEGVGKSTTVYTLVEESSGYVYEINASQDRGRKDILANLKELSTTQLVHQNQDIIENNDFQKGVILFEDVDILFESDKGFWSVLESVLMISRRPIILTCSDLSVVPPHILESAQDEHAVFELKKTSPQLLKDYLFLVGLVNRFEIDDIVLQQLIEENKEDLRRSLTNLQMLCKTERVQSGLVRIISNDISEDRITIDEELDLKVFSEKLDTLSIIDLVESSSKSLINHESPPNELVSEYKSINEDELRIPSLSFEFNFAKELRKQLPNYPIKELKHSIKDAKTLGKVFLQSKYKDFKRLTRGSLMNSISDFSDNYENSVFDILPSSFYVTEVSPLLREFARYDETALLYNREVIEREHPKPYEELVQLGLLKKRKFSALPNLLLYGIFNDRSQSTEQLQQSA